MKMAGIPVLFIPGNAGSYKQGMCSKTYQKNPKLVYIPPQIKVRGYI